MADHYIKKDGAWKKLNDSEFEAEFGYTPTTPRTGEYTFGGRYEHNTFNTGSVSATTGFPTDPLAIKNTGNTDFSGLEVGSGSGA
tara:strand:- start:51 stop:305 length:255 start_codon:yes stop_codon:yes gene_type:complete